MPKITEKALQACDAKPDIGAEMLQSVRDLKSGRWGRKTTIETMPGGTVRRRVELPNGTVAKDEVLTARVGHWCLHVRIQVYRRQTLQKRWACLNAQ